MNKSYKELHDRHHELLKIVNKAMNIEWSGKCESCMDEEGNTGDITEESSREEIRKYILSELWRFNNEILTNDFVDLLDDSNLTFNETVYLAEMLSAYKKLRDSLEMNA